LGDGIAAIRAGFESSNGKCVSQRMRRGPSLSHSRWQPSPLNRCAECFVDILD